MHSSELPTQSSNYFNGMPEYAGNQNYGKDESVNV
jgi:hypothetical protein